MVIMEKGRDEISEDTDVWIADFLHNLKAAPLREPLYIHNGRLFT
jgi:hypothetical protein